MQPRWPLWPHKAKESGMNNARRHFSPALMALLALAAAFAGPAAAAAGKTDLAAAQTRYQQERAVCLNGQSNQDRSTCLREAGAAYAQARKGGLDDGPADYTRNASQRCDVLPGADRLDCLARMQGQGTTSGSVAGGGIYRELVTRESATSAPAPSGAASAAPAR